MKKGSIYLLFNEITDTGQSSTLVLCITEHIATLMAAELIKKGEVVSSNVTTRFCQRAYIHLHSTSRIIMTLVSQLAL